MINEVCKWIGRALKIYAALAVLTSFVADTFSITIMGLITLSKGIYD